MDKDCCVPCCFEMAHKLLEVYKCCNDPCCVGCKEAVKKALLACINCCIQVNDQPNCDV